MTGAECHECGKAASEMFHGLCRDCFVDAYDTDHAEDFDPEGPAFECAAIIDGRGIYCPLWGSEECDWECPRGGLAT